MPETLEQYKEQLAKLPTKDRAELAHFLLESLDDGAGGGDDEEIEAAWMAEVNRRIKELDEGKVKAIPAEEVLERLRKKYP